MKISLERILAYFLIVRLLLECIWILELGAILGNYRANELLRHSRILEFSAEFSALESSLKTCELIIDYVIMITVNDVWVDRQNYAKNLAKTGWNAYRKSAQTPRVVKVITGYFIMITCSRHISFGNKAKNFYTSYRDGKRKVTVLHFLITSAIEEEKNT